MVDQKTHRPIRSFVIRGGRMTPSQQKAFDDLWPSWGLQSESGVLTFPSLFGREAPTALEIGFGMGSSLLEMAENQPDWNFIGVEVHKPGVGAVLREVEARGLNNLRLFWEDANLVLDQAIADASLSRVQIYFPDPWHKKRHNKRRLVQPEFVQRIRRKLTTGGVLHMATDWEPYAEHMLEVMEAAPGYSNLASDGGYSPRPDYRPVTKFEKRGERLGHGVWDLLYQAVES